MHSTSSAYERFQAYSSVKSELLSDGRKGKKACKLLEALAELIDPDLFGKVGGLPIPQYPFPPSPFDQRSGSF